MMVLSSNIDIFLYGDNSFSRESYQKLQKSGYKVMGIIDQKISQKTYAEGFLFFDPNLTEWHEPLEHAVVVVCLKDGSNHDRIVTLLNRIGFNYILFLPFDNSMPINEQDKLRFSFGMFSMGEYNQIEIPKFVRQSDNPFIEIRRTKTHISFWCDENCLIPYNEEIYVSHSHRKNGNIMKKYVGCTIDEFIPFINLFKYLGGEKNTDISEYLMLQREDESEHSAFLLNREMLYKEYEQKFIYNMGFFTDSPPFVQLDRARNRFVIFDGLHRVYYLKQKGLSRYPVISSLTDYEAFLNSMKS